MDTERDESEVAATYNTVSVLEARDEMERVLSDPEFRCADRNKKFLKFVSEELFAGREEAVKAYSIAVDVFGRPPTFDPAIDPIVRIEATRLRSALAHYYDVHGSDRDVVIDLPKGRYVPQFSRNDRRSAASRPLSDGAPKRAAPGWVVSSWKRKLVPALGVAAFVVALLVAASLGWFDGRAFARISEKPAVTIELVENTPQDSRATALRDALMVAVSGFQTLRVVTPETVVAALERSSGTVQSRYRVSLKHSTDASGSRVWWQLIDRQTGEVLRTGQELFPRGDISPTADAQIVSKLAIRLASSDGVINAIETTRDLGRPSLGNGCILRSGLALEARSVVSLRQALSCLEQTLSRRPYDADAHAVLAIVIVTLAELNGSVEDMKPAIEHANAAAALAPDSHRSQMAMMIAAFHAGRPQAAISAGRRALELNPHNMTATARLGRILFSVGEWQEGLELAEKAAAEDPLQNDAELTFALEAFRRGRCGEAVLRLQQFPDASNHFVQLLLPLLWGASAGSKKRTTWFPAFRISDPISIVPYMRTCSGNLEPSLVLALTDRLQLTDLSNRHSQR